MNIPFYYTDKPECEIVCLQMVLSYYGFQKDLEDLYAPIETIGVQHSILPWGICLAAESFGLYSIFISEKPKQLAESSIIHIIQKCNISKEEINKLVSSQLERCEKSDKIVLENWKEDYRILPKSIVKTAQGIVIPIIMWHNNEPPHAIVITDYTESKIIYHNPTCQIGENWQKKHSEFYNKWLHPDLDKDLYIISKKQININALITC